MEKDEARTGAAVVEAGKEKQLQFLRHEIAKLECKQLAESIVAITKAAPEYELRFDPTIDVAPMRFDLEGVKVLARYQKDIFNTSPYDASIAAAMQFNYSAKKRSCHKEKTPAKPVKQIRNLFDEEVMGRDIDFALYGLCHHCKEIKPRFTLVKCKSCEAKSVPEEEKKTGKHKKTPAKEPKPFCERLFCFSCIHFNYDQDPTAAQTDPAWACPFCQVSHRMQKETIEKLLLLAMPPTGTS